MKKTLTLLFVSQTVLLAGVAEMQTLYDQKKYEQVIAEAQKSTSEYGNPELHLLWAKSAKALHKDEMAMSAYERVLMIDPDNKDVRVQLAILYATTERNDLANKMSRSLENYQLTPAQRTSLETLNKGDLEHLNASASIAIGYDSNVNVSPGDLDLPLFGKEIGTMFTLFKGSLSYIHDLDEMGGWYLRSDADIYYQNNADASYYNLLAGSVDIGPGYSEGAYDVYLPVSYRRFHYLDRDFLESVSFDPRINIALSASYILNLNARYTQRTYLDEADKNRDDSVAGIGAGLYWFLDDNFAYINTNYDNYSAKYSESLPFTDKETMRISMGVNYYVIDWFFARLDYSYRYAKYEDHVKDSEDERRDRYNQLEMKVSRMISDTLEASLLYRYSQNNSNYAAMEYDKDVVMLGLQYNY